MRCRDRQPAHCLIRPDHRRGRPASLAPRSGGLARTRSPGQCLLDLVGEQHARSHRVGQFEGRPDVALGLAHQRPEQGADIEHHRRPPCLVAEGLREL